MKRLTITSKPHVVEFTVAKNGKPYVMSKGEESSLGTPITMKDARRLHAWLSTLLATEEACEAGHPIAKGAKACDHDCGGT